MCGICGIFHRDSNPRVERSALAAMNMQIVHRGPDDEGMFIDGNVGLAMRRLSIIDVQSGHQPMANEDQNLWIVYNGEIYNHQELRNGLESRGHRYRTRSDTEAILHLYEEYGADCVNHLRGMFAFAIWNKRERRLFVARDRFGIKPLYYWHDGKTFLFGSEIKSILAHPGVRTEFNKTVLAEYLAFGYIAGPATLFAGIQKLLPGHSLEISETIHIKIQQYWDLAFEQGTDEHPRDYYVNRYRELLEESVGSHLMSDVPLGVFLSGGLDSSVVAALATRARGRRIKTFSVGYAEDAFSELPYARQVAEHISSEHHEVRLSCDEFFAALPELIWHEDEPLVWPSSVPLYFVSRLARQHVTVVLTGEGADETLAGYTRYAFTLKNSAADSLYRALTSASLRRLMREAINRSHLPANLQRKLDHTFLIRDGAAWSSFYFDNFYSAFTADEQKDLLNDEIVDGTGDPYAGSMNYWNKSSGNILHRLLYTDIKTYLGELLMKQDQMSMAASIESRVPFLDHRLVEFASTIPEKYSIKGLGGKTILKSAAKDLLPKSIIHRTKMGFPTPWPHWMAGKPLDAVEERLLDSRSLERRLFKAEGILHLFSEHRARRRDHGNRIWRLLNLELWQRVFLDGEKSWQSGDSSISHASRSGCSHSLT
jgi:asparagine synthase (glutamine-hydrolysing)